MSAGNCWQQKHVVMLLLTATNNDWKPRVQLLPSAVQMLLAGSTTCLLRANLVSKKTIEILSRQTLLPPPRRSCFPQRLSVCLSVCLPMCMYVCWKLISRKKTTDRIFVKFYQRCVFGQSIPTGYAVHVDQDPPWRRYAIFECCCCQYNAICIQYVQRMLAYWTKDSQ